MSNELKALMEIDRDYLLPAAIALVMHWDTHALRLQAREDPSKLGFPVLVYGSRVKIPKIRSCSLWVYYITKRRTEPVC